LSSAHDPLVPATVSDAILLAAAIGVHYVWVDSLCIVQDDEKLDNVHLASMAAICANAYVTIVAAVGKDARHGIAGVPKGSHTRNLPCRIIQSEIGLKWLPRKLHKAWPTDFKWNTRGW
jgi:exosome complex RNA-binding protein Rrp42 (RNase PH superfamily)